MTRILGPISGLDRKLDHTGPQTGQMNSFLDFILIALEKWIFVSFMFMRDYTWLFMHANKIS